MSLARNIVGSGPPLILLPWFGLDRHVMAAACEPALSGTDWQRIYLDLPGTGGSAPARPHSDAIADVVEQTVAETAGPARAALAGCSYGGYIAAEVARRNPARFSGLLLVCSGVRIRPGDRDLSGLRPPDPEPGWLDDVPEDLHAYFSLAVGRQTRDVAARLAAALRLNGPADKNYLDALRSAGYQLSAESALAVPGPDSACMVIAGARDQIGGYRDQLAFAVAAQPGPAGSGQAGGPAEAARPAADFVLLAESGHFAPFEQPDQFRVLLLGWLARCRAAG